MTRIARFLRADSGAAMVEFSLVATLVFFPLVFGLIEFGRVVMIKSAVTAAAREGVRFAIVHGGSSGKVADSTMVADSVKARTKIAPITVRTTWTPDKAPGSTATVQVTYSYVPIVRLISARTITSQSQQIINF
jgi:Flp pilus assembly protein TadG